MFRRLLIPLLVSLIAPAAAMATPVFFGPTSYLSSADTPSGFYIGGVALGLEDFEDGTLDFGITGSAGAVWGPGGGSDSVDGDDGAIDGSGTAGLSWLNADGVSGVTFTFSSVVTAAGFVFTDGGGIGIFEAFGPGMISLGTFGTGFLGGAGSGVTFDDRFLGVQDPDGIIAIKLSMSEGGIELDHIQFGIVPEPGTAALLSLGLVALAHARRRSTP